MVAELKHAVHQKDEGSAPTGRTRGRPPATSARAIAATALRLFAEHGFEETTMDDVAREVGVARRTLFSYYRTKNAIVWDGHDAASTAVAAALDAVPADLDWRPALVTTLPAALRYPDDDLDLLRRRLTLIGATPGLRAHLDTAQDATVGAVTRFIADRSGADPGDLVPHLLARVALTTLTTALVWWAGTTDTDPRATVSQALREVLLPTGTPPGPPPRG